MQDKAWKVRPWIDKLQNNLKTLVPSEHQSIDEVMIAFKGRSSLKQYMRNKPHKWGIKLWARAGTEGILHDFEIYQGSIPSPSNTNPGPSNTDTCPSNTTPGPSNANYDPPNANINPSNANPGPSNTDTDSSVTNPGL